MDMMHVGIRSKVVPVRVCTFPVVDDHVRDMMKHCLCDDETEVEKCHKN